MIDQINQIRREREKDLWLWVVNVKIGILNLSTLNTRYRNQRTISASNPLWNDFTTLSLSGQNPNILTRSAEEKSPPGNHLQHYGTAKIIADKKLWMVNKKSKH